MEMNEEWITDDEMARIIFGESFDSATQADM